MFLLKLVLVILPVVLLQVQANILPENGAPKNASSLGENLTTAIVNLDELAILKQWRDYNILVPTTQNSYLNEFKNLPDKVVQELRNLTKNPVLSKILPPIHKILASRESLLYSHNRVSISREEAKSMIKSIFEIEDLNDLPSVINQVYCDYKTIQAGLDAGLKSLYKIYPVIERYFTEIDNLNDKMLTLFKPVFESIQPYTVCNPKILKPKTTEITTTERGTDATTLPTTTTTPATPYIPITTEPATYSPTATESATYSPTTTESATYTQDTTEPATFTQDTTEPATFTQDTTEPATYTPTATESVAYTQTTTESTVETPSTTESTMGTQSTPESTVETPSTTEPGAYTPTSTEQGYTPTTTEEVFSTTEPVHTSPTTIEPTFSTTRIPTTSEQTLTTEPVSTATTGEQTITTEAGGTPTTPEPIYSSTENPASTELVDVQNAIAQSVVQNKGGINSSLYSPLFMLLLFGVALII